MLVLTANAESSLEPVPPTIPFKPKSSILMEAYAEPAFMSSLKYMDTFVTAILVVPSVVLLGW
jgi:hypothetical protein